MGIVRRTKAIIGGVSRLVESSSCILHVCSEDPRGEDLLWRLQHAEATIDPSLAKAHRQPDTMIMRAPTNYKGLVGACLKHQEPMVVWDAQQDARYCAEVDSAENSVRHGATIACVPLVDERWQVSGAQPHAIGVLQLVVNTGPDRGRKKRLGLELRALLLVVRPHSVLHLPTWVGALNPRCRPRTNLGFSLLHSWGDKRGNVSQMR
jgi:hypothetical protein